MKRMFLRALALAGVLAIAVGVPLAAIAQPPSPADLAGAICAPGNRPLLIALIAIALASAMTWSKRFMLALPAPLQHTVNLIALNWRPIAVAMNLIPAMLLILVLAGCAGSSPGASAGSIPHLPAIDQEKALYFLKAAGCVGDVAADVAAPIVQAKSDAKGNAVLTTAGNVLGKVCSVSVPPPAVAAPAP
jgi:hypothetical protein